MNRQAGSGGEGTAGESLGDLQGLKQPLSTRPCPRHRDTVSDLCRIDDRSDDQCSREENSVSGGGVGGFQDTARRRKFTFLEAPREGGV